MPYDIYRLLPKIDTYYYITSFVLVQLVNEWTRLSINMEDDLFTTLYSNLEPGKKLYMAVSNNHIDYLQEILANGIDVNIKVQQQGGNKALHIACKNGHKECVGLLLKNGANHCITNDFGHTPLHAALLSTSSKAVACVALLLECGGVLTETSLIWNASLSQNYIQSSPYLWSKLSTELLKVLLVATSDPGLWNLESRACFVSEKLLPNNLDLLKAYVLSGNILQGSHLTKLMAEPNPDLQYFLKQTVAAQSLQQYSRVAVRKFLKPNVLHGARFLPLPQKMVDFVLMKDVWP